MQKVRKGGYPKGLLAAFMGLFSVGHKATQKPSGNRAVPLVIQHEIKSEALDKRLRKLDRIGGWYNG